MNTRFGAGAAVFAVLLTGCYGWSSRSGPDAGADAPVGECSPDASNCAPGYVCHGWNLRTGFAWGCWPACDPAVGRLCPDDSVCWRTSLTPEFTWACYPGQMESAAECLTPHDCARGQGCRRTLPDLPGTCVEACNDDSDCPTQEACGAYAACTPVCVRSDASTCPPDRICWAGECVLAEPARECPDSDGSRPGSIPQNCPLGEYCGGWDDRSFTCFAEDVNARRCRPDQSFYRVTGACYPRES